MLVKDLMTREIVSCTPWDTARTAAHLMKEQGIGALPVVSASSDPLLEGIVTDRDLCCGVVADGKNVDAIRISELMTPIPVTCQPDSTVEGCEELMRENQVRRIPVVDNRGRCVGMISQADIALHAPAEEVARTMSEISRSAKPSRNVHFNKDFFYCGLLHEQDEILLLNRRRDLRQEVEAVR